MSKLENRMDDCPSNGSNKQVNLLMLLETIVQIDLIIYSNLEN